MNFKIIQLGILVVSIFTNVARSEDRILLNEESERRWFLVVGDGKNSNENDLATLKVTLDSSEGPKRFCVKGIASDLWILMNCSSLEANAYLKGLVDKSKYKWIYIGAVEGIGLEGVNDKWIKSMSLAKLDDSYKPKQLADAIVVKTDAGLLIAASPSLYDSLNKVVSKINPGIKLSH